jgi:Family of unknown function (DUF5302)
MASDEAEAEHPEQPDDELKRHFREALERKRNQQADATGGLDGKDPSKVHGTHGPASRKRSFRRKSGA